MIYRFKALAKMRDPDRLDATMSLANPRGWIAVLVVGSCLMMFAIWASLGRVPHTVTGSGELVYPGGVRDIETPVAGLLADLSASPGDVISKGEPIAVVRTEQGDVTIDARQGGRVVWAERAIGRMVASGTPLLALEPGYGDDEPLQVSLLVPAGEAGLVRTGSEVRMQVAGHEARIVGLLLGTVTDKADFPEARSDGQIGDTRVMVSIESADTPSGYSWTSSTGPSQTLVSQTPVEAEIVIGERSPLSAFSGG